MSMPMQGSLRDHVQRTIAGLEPGDSIEVAVTAGVHAVGDWLAENSTFGQYGAESQTEYIARMLRQYS